MKKVILGYWAVGVTALVDRLCEAGTPAVEVRDFPLDVDIIRKLQSEGVVVFSYICPENIQVLQRELVEFVLVYPAMNCIEDYSARWAKQGLAGKAIYSRRLKWVDEIAKISGTQDCLQICLGRGQYIPDLDDPRYNEVPAGKGNK